MDSSIIGQLVAGTIIPADIARIFVGHVQSTPSRPERDTNKTIKPPSDEDFTNFIKGIYSSPLLTRFQVCCAANTSLPILVKWSNGKSLPDPSARKSILDSITQEIQNAN